MKRHSRPSRWTILENEIMSAAMRPLFGEFSNEQSDVSEQSIDLHLTAGSWIDQDDFH
jgi:hypothetical protein